MSCCAFTTPIQASGSSALASSWQTRAIANGGTPSSKTLGALNTFCLGIQAQTYYTKLKSVNFLAPDDFRCAMTPLIVHATDAGLWLAQTGNFPAGGNAFVSGGNAQLGALGIRCDYPYAASPGTNNYNPTALFSARDNWGVTIYTTTNDGAHGPQGTSWGVDDTINANWGTNNNFGFTSLSADDTAPTISAAFSFYGYYSFNIVSAGSRIIYAASSAHAHAVFLTSALVFGGGLSAREFAWAGFNNNLANSGGTSNWHSFFAAHDFLTAVESLDFFTRIQALRVSLGTGFV